MANNELHVVVMGSTDFALPALKTLVASDRYNVVCVVCQPDRPNGRGKKRRPGPMKKAAQALDIPVFQPERIRDEEAVTYLKSLSPDFFVVAAYGQILSQEVLDIPTYGCINLHGSLLPKYRGAAPIHHAIINGETETGVTIMKMNAGMDTGDMLDKVVLPITDTTTVGAMHDAMAKKGAAALLPVLDRLTAGEAFGEKQDEAQATYADKIDKNTGKIDWQAPCDQIIRRINGTDPWPGPWTTYDGKKMKCFSPAIVSHENAVPGKVLTADENSGLTIGGGDGVIRLDEVQMPGKRRMKVSDYLRGNAIAVGTILGR